MRRHVIHRSHLLQYTRQYLRQAARHLGTASTDVPHVAVVGSGPAGFYTAKQILKGHPTAQIDVFEKLPVPFGLVRFGVAPDHPEVKNVINTFTSTAQNPRCQFVGNVCVGRDVTVSQLRDAYTAVVLANGADTDKTFGIPGEDLRGVLSARSFVGWYNGLPQDSQLQPMLDTDTAVVLGQGNVALDVARILLSPIDKLKKTDITESSLEALSRSRVKRVYLVGRRGPLQVAFTIAELREMVRLQGTRPVLNPQDYVGLEKVVNDIPRPRKRLTELMIKTATEGSQSGLNLKEWHLKFLRSPVEFLPESPGGSTVGSVKLQVNRLEGEVGGYQRAVGTEETEELKCGLVLRSIGYRSVALEEGAPFDPEHGIIPNTGGRVEGYPGLYCSGWVKRGPVGVIVSTMNDAFETGRALVEDLNTEALTGAGHRGCREQLMGALRDNGVRMVNFSDWEKIDCAEMEQGARIGKPREKITSVQDMLTVVGVS